MKMPIEEYDRLVEAVRPFDTPERRQQYLSGNFRNADSCRDLDKRYRWDLFYGYHPTNFAGRMYQRGMNDEHIETALRKFIPTLGVVIHNADGSINYLATKIGQGMSILADVPSPSVEQLTHEHRIAIREAEEIAHSDEFFAARPGMDTIANRNLFRHGYFRGYDKGQGHL